MNVHKNARLTPHGRALMVSRVLDEGWSVAASAEAAGVSERTCHKWLGRHRRGPSEDFTDRSSAPRRCPRRTPPQRVAEIEQLRRQRMSGAQIAAASLGQEDATAFLERALAWYARLGVTVERVMTDNGSAYRSKRFAAALKKAGVRHVRTRPYTPRTNGKAERFIQTSLREWAYARAYASSEQRSAAIQPWIDSYNLSRPHAGIGHLSPWQRLNNLLGNDTYAATAGAARMPLCTGPRPTTAS
jgi:transposase